MKRLLALLLFLSMSLALCACSGSSAPASGTDALHIDGIYADSTYYHPDNASLKMVYLFYTVSAQDQSLLVDAISTQLTIDGTNTYQAAHYSKACANMGSYYYSSYPKEVYPGETLKVVETFRVPQDDLAPGKPLSLTKDQVPQMETLSLTTDEILSCQGTEAIAEAADPAGYAKALERQETADPDVTQTVQAAINGRAWTFYISGTTHRVDFNAPNQFTFTTLGTTYQGTYTVKKGFISCQSDATDHVVDLPYTLTPDGGIDLDFFTAFDGKIS